MKTVLVTGASGFLGSHLVNNLLLKGMRVISAIMPCEVDTYVEKEGEQVVLNDAVFAGALPPLDVVVNCAFARSNAADQLASAFDYTAALIAGLKKVKVGGLINISSQGVYKRLPVGELAKEDAPIEPVDLYSMSKYAAEKMFLLSGIGCVTNVRLASLSMKQRFLYAFVRSARESGVINLNSPHVYASLLDVEDAAEALAALACLPPSRWKDVYNLSIGAQFSLAEFAEAVKRVGERKGLKIEIVTNDNGAAGTAGTDISRLTADTGWTPKVTNEMMIDKLFSI